MSDDSIRVPPRQVLLTRAKRSAVMGGQALQRVAFNQLLHRLHRNSAGSFTVKGGFALVSRGVTERKTDDLDLRGNASEIKVTVDLFLAAAMSDIGDGLEFTLTSEPTVLSGQATGGNAGARVKLICTQGGVFFERIKVDLVVGREPSGHVRTSTAPETVAAPEITSAPIDLYPIEDQIADKVWASLGIYGHDGKSSRIHDLHDLCTITLRATPDAVLLSEALEEERMRRRLEPITSFDPPAAWRDQWRLTLRKDPDEEIPADYDEAVALARLLVEPVVGAAIVGGTWHPDTLSWS